MSKPGSGSFSGLDLRLWCPHFSNLLNTSKIFTEREKEYLDWNKLEVYVLESLDYGFASRNCSVQLRPQSLECRERFHEKESSVTYHLRKGREWEARFWWYRTLKLVPQRCHHHPCKLLHRGLYRTIWVTGEERFYDMSTWSTWENGLPTTLFAL